MGGGGVPSGGVTIKYGKRGDFDTEFTPNSRQDLYVNGKKVQSRWFDYKGKVIRNRDYDHQDAHHTHIFPHDYDWVWKDNRPIRDTQWVDPDFIRYPEDKS